jgi:hypothetical protein
MDEATANKFLQAAQAGKLSTRDRAAFNQMRRLGTFSPNELISTISQEVATAPQDLESINVQISRTKNAQIKAVLETERENILSLIDDMRVKQYEAPDTSIVDKLMGTISSLFSSQSSAPK